MPFRLFAMFRSSLPASHDGLTQPQREAIADLLHFCIYADNHIALAETKTVEDAVQSFAWDPAVSFDSFESRSIAAARQAREDKHVRAAFLASVRERLTTPQARTLAFGLVNRLFASDGTRTDGESTLHDELRRLLV